MKKFIFFITILFQTNILAIGLDFNEIYKSAQNGDIKSQSALAEMYDLGVEVDQDILKAIFWYNKAASQGNPESRIT